MPPETLRSLSPDVKPETVCMAEPQHRNKTATINLRVDAEVKAMAERAAAADRRSLTSYIEKLIEDDVAGRRRSSFPNQVMTQPRRSERQR